MQTRTHDISSIEIARALIRLMQMQPSAARWLLFQVRSVLCLRLNRLTPLTPPPPLFHAPFLLQCTKPTSPGLAEVASSALLIGTSGTSSAAVTYKTWLVRGLLNAASDISRDLFSVVLQVAVQEAAVADSRGGKCSSSVSTILFNAEPLPAAICTELLELGTPCEGDSEFAGAAEARAALYQFPLDHDLMCALKIDAAKVAEISAQEMFDKVVGPYRAESDRLASITINLDSARSNLTSMEMRSLLPPTLMKPGPSYAAIEKARVAVTSAEEDVANSRAHVATLEVRLLLVLRDRDSNSIAFYFCTICAGGEKCCL